MKSFQLVSGWGTAAGLVLSLACAPAAPAPPAAPVPAVPQSGAPAPVVEQKEKPQYGGVFQFYGNDAPANLDPFNDTFIFSQTFLGTLYENLVNYDSDKPGFDWRNDLDVRPWLAEKWEQKDPTTYVFTLKDAKFHDGKPVTVDDVVWSYEYLRDPKNNKGYRGSLKFLDKVTKIDNKTVQLTTKSVAAYFLSDLATRGTVIAPKHIFDAGGQDALNSTGIGSGPFKLKKFDPKGKSELVRFESYWFKDEFGQQMPYLDGFHITHNMDQAAVQAAIAARKIDIYQALDRPSAEALRQRLPDLQMDPFITDNSIVLFINQTRKPWDDVRVRRAAHLAIDRNEILQTLYFGEGRFVVPAPSTSTKLGWGFSQEDLQKLPGWRKEKAADVADAKKLLAEAGYPNGFKGRLIYPRTYSSAPQAEVAPNYLKTVGIEMELAGLDQPTVNKEAKDLNYDLWLAVTANAALIPYTQAYYTADAPNSGGWKNPQFDDLTKKLGETLDKNEQKKIVRQMQEIWLQELPALTLLDNAIYKVQQPWVRNWRTQFGNQPTVYYGGPYLWFVQDKLPDFRKSEKP